MTVLVVLIGPPGAGKSSWTASRFHQDQVVNLDAIRGWVCDNQSDQTATADAVEIQNLLLTARCRRRRLPVVDATNLGGQVRGELLAHARRNRMLAVAVVFDVPLEVCLTRNRARDCVVPEAVVARMHQQLAGAIPAAGGVPGFDITHRLGHTHDHLLGRVPAEHQDATWLR